MAAEESTIGELLDETGGSIKTGPFGTKLKASEYTETGVPVISVGEVGFGRLRIHAKTPRVDETVWKRMPEFLLKEGDIVFGRKGAVERSAQLQPEEDGYFLGSDGIRIRLNAEACDPKFIAYQLQTTAHRNWMIQHAAGTTMPSLNEGVIRRIPIVVKPLAEQKAIAKILSSFDDKIELNRRMNATLEAIARALFKAWFVDFEPVRANKENRAPTSASPEIANLFPSEFESGIPKGWSTVRLGDEVHVFDFVANGSFESLRNNVQTYDQPNHALYLRTTDYNSHFRSSLKYLDKSSYEFLSKSSLSGAETIISNIGNVGTIFRPPSWLGVPMALGSNAVGLRSRFPSYVFRYFESHFGQHQLRSITTGSAQPKFNKTNLRDLRILYPSEAVGRAFDDFESAILDKENSNKKESRQIADIRDSLLPRLISGKIRVDA